MRLICPNCDAQYEVVDDVIPTEGRDVQCSNCGQTWFQHHPDHMPEDVTEAAPDLPEDTPAPDEERVSAPDPESEQPRRQELDPAVTDILRQEAEIEAQARAQSSAPLESQPDLGLDDAAETEAARRARDARDRMARMRGEESISAPQVSEAAATAAAIGSRRDLLPDIEEINSTLRSTGDRQSGLSDESTSGDADVAPRGRSGFRRGFFTVVLIVLVLGAIYIFAPRIAQAVPAMDAALTSYVAQVDMLRNWLDGHVTALLTWLDSAAAQNGDG